MPPACERCSAPLRAATADEVHGYDPDAAGVVPPSKSPDVTGMFAVFVIWPVLVPLAGIRVGSLAFGVPVVLLLFGASRAAKAAGRAGRDRRPVWLLLCVAASLGALASGVTVLAPETGTLAKAGFYLGFGASAFLLAAMWRFVRVSARDARLERVVDAALLLLLITALSAYFVAIPGFLHGDFVLTLVFVLDLSAVLFASFAAVIRRQLRHRRIGGALVAMTASAAAGDAVIALSTTGLHVTPSVTALMWAGAGFACAFAADEERGDAEADPELPETMDRGWVLARVVFPLVVVLAFPGMAIPLWAAGDLSAWAGIYYGVCFVAALSIAFGRQAYLLLDNRLAVARERRLREDAVRRSEQLEALTGLATTMTQTLEEEPIVKRSLGVLHTAARASSSAIHLAVDGGLQLRAAHGNWYGEHPWADRMPPAPQPPHELRTRGGRQIVRLPLMTRDHLLGTVTLIRPERDAFGDEELGLLGLLVDELAVAIQHARDYDERLEQAIRDPLTGLYNRRFFLEAAGKEIARAHRSTSTASLVLIDVDNFKEVNDSFGHAAGDEVLRRIGAIVERNVRPMDTFARIGGEEFGLLLPETTQLSALMVADRIRTAIARDPLLPGRKVTVSAGLASCPEDARELDELHRRADAALYLSKRNGKDMCAVASEVSQQAVADESSPSLLHLFGLVELLDSGPLQTRAHSQTVASYAVAIGNRLDLPSEQLMKLRRAALLHDVGKISVPAEILNKPARLTEDEFRTVQGHSTAGGLMVAHAGLRDEAQWVRWHHERIDGAGYPDGLSGDEIPLEARILFVADSFEAMTSDRPYRSGMVTADALEELERCAGTQFDPDAVAALASLVREGELDVLAIRDAHVA
jgi:diguanylate cyclase (GGDEF)-like protein